MFMIRKPQAGITLIELLIGMLVGLIVVAGGMSIYIASVRGQTENIKLARLNQDMRAMMDMMERDIRRAGFVTSDPATNFASLQSNPFFDSSAPNFAELTVYNPGPTAGSCIVYSYNRDDNDANHDGVIGDIESPPAVDSNERLGFRLNGDAGELEMRSRGDTNEDCDDGEWESITEPEVEITGVTFSLDATVLDVSSMAKDTDGDGCVDGDDKDPATYSATCKTGNYGNNLCDTGESCNIDPPCPSANSTGDPAYLCVRKVTIKLDGQLRDDNAVKQTITEQVRIRNDKFLDAIP